MECHICGRQPGEGVDYNCATCARSALYPLRLKHATTLLNKERLGRRVEAIVQGMRNTQEPSLSLEGAVIDTNECVKRVDLERMRAEITRAEQRVELAAEQARRLREEMEDYEKTIALRKAALAQRRSDAESATHNLDARRTEELEAIRKSIKRTEYKWNRLHVDTVQSRLLLCREAASLAGLKPRKRKNKDGTSRDDYSVGGVRIHDLRDLNSEHKCRWCDLAANHRLGASPTQLTASLTYVAQLLVRITHYLAVRLPAEVTLPHRDYPLATIFAPSSSYLARDVPFPGFTPPHSSNNSPSASRTLDLPKPRPLFIEQKLPKLAKEDPAAYTTFIEGAALLAWNIAWLCRTQGMTSGFNSWEDICPLGKNLWRLLMAEEQAPQLRRELSGRDVTGNTDPSKRTPATSSPVKSLGQFSHGTAHSFLGAAEGTETMRSWKYQTPTRIIDRTRKHLLDELQGAEWEVLDEKEWAFNDEMAEDEPVIVGTRRRDMERDDDAKSVFSVGTTATGRTEGPEVTGQGKGKGVNGWTKLKSRSGEATQ